MSLSVSSSSSIFATNSRTAGSVRFSTYRPRAVSVVRPGLRVDPVGMLGEQVGVGIHHLRFHPDPEVHAQFADPGDQRSQAVRELHGIDPTSRRDRR